MLFTRCSNEELQNLYRSKLLQRNELRTKNISSSMATAHAAYVAFDAVSLGVATGGLSTLCHAAVALGGAPYKLFSNDEEKEEKLTKEIKGIKCELSRPGEAPQKLGFLTRATSSAGVAATSALVSEARSYVGGLDIDVDVDVNVTDVNMHGADIVDIDIDVEVDVREEGKWGEVDLLHVDGHLKYCHCYQCCRY